MQCKSFYFSSGKSQISIFLHLKDKLLPNLLTMLEATTQVEIPPTDSSVVIDDAVATVSEWGDSVNPTIMMDIMKRLKVSDNVNLIGTNKKNFWPSYPKTWAQLNDGQKNKAVEWFRNCSVAGKQALLAKATAETEASLSKNDQDIDEQKRPKVHKNDLARLLHLRKCAEASITWGKIGSTLNRRQLDARKSDTPDVGGGTMASAGDYYGTLSEIYNDYENFRPQNYLIGYKHDDKTNRPAPVVPWVSASPDTETLFSKCKDLNPCDDSRANIHRDGAWIKDYWTKLRGFLSLIYVDYERSGKNNNKEGEGEIEWMGIREQVRWVYHAGTKNRLNDQVTTYSYGLLDQADFADSLGKEMQKGTGVDSSLSGQKISSSDKRKGKRKLGGRARDCEPERDTADLTSIIADALSMDNERQSMSLLLQFGDAKDKADALQRLRQLANRSVVALEPDETYPKTPRQDKGGQRSSVSSSISSQSYFNNSDTSEEEDVEEDNSYNHVDYVDAIAVDGYDVDDMTDTRDSGTS